MRLSMFLVYEAAVEVDKPSVLLLHAAVIAVGGFACSNLTRLVDEAQEGYDHSQRPLVEQAL